ncbi:interleukin-6 receptor subunit beta isoform X2 [Thalassophryne amazonica]|uniref:interleukin-6 receptor subunit beta isoform X2 n=1 Tax=Thalassophryne amazonica TaxID=390379 RepID=UPI0014713F79|nr:interleukin-6 receptor subunit beta isoform X2 [Thalassophryne amazonica]
MVLWRIEHQLLALACLASGLLASDDRPEKPANLSCVAVQEKSVFNKISCFWNPGTDRNTEIHTTYTLKVIVFYYKNFSVVAKENNRAQVALGTFPHHMNMDIWVEAENKLGKEESSHLKEEAEMFVKTSPPSDVQVISEKSFPTSLLITWKHPIGNEYVTLMYQIRFCRNGSHNWTYVPLSDTSRGIQSFRLQKLLPYTAYITQVRCKCSVEGYGYWSEWSSNATRRTPEDQPRSKPDLWQIITSGDDINERQVKIICKDPVLSNGRITSFDIRVGGRAEWESILVNRSENQREITFLKEIYLADKEFAKVEVTAHNSVGTSPKAVLVIPKIGHELAPVEGLKVWPYRGQLWLEWKLPSITTPINVTHYVVEWKSDIDIAWQWENRGTTRTEIKDDLEYFKCYNISVYPIYSGWIGKPVTTEAFREQGAPLEGPSVRLNGKAGPSEAELVWNEIPRDKQRGFITNYTIFYSSGTNLYNETVPAKTYSYTLKQLLSNTKYETWIKASTIAGSAIGPKHSFSTVKYAPGEFEGIVVGICFGVLVFLLGTMMICICKRHVIKQKFWPQIPNPGNSSIGSWSPDYPLKADTPKESSLAGVSVLEVDLFDGRSVFDDDKTSLPLKKDKYLSEEHSSGIGGSSCMSSPRQSVSDSDEGGDVGETTASTVQYSSVVASSGYKGQTPTSQPQQAIFSRSESTQPLLDSEETPDMLGQEGSEQSKRRPRNPGFSQAEVRSDNADSPDFTQLEMEEQSALESLSFHPIVEDCEQAEEAACGWLQSAKVPSYMPQRGGYRPQ